MLFFIKTVLIITGSLTALPFNRIRKISAEVATLETMSIGRDDCIELVVLLCGTDVMRECDVL